MELYWHFKFGPIDFGSDEKKRPLPPPPPHPHGPHPLPPPPPRPDWRHPRPRPLRDGTDESWNMLIDDLAQAIHESCREAVEQGKTMAAINGCSDRSFIEWNDLPEEAKEGRRIQARWFLDVCGIEEELKNNSEEE